jgi:hypothetical protein
VLFPFGITVLGLAIIGGMGAYLGCEDEDKFYFMFQQTLIAHRYLVIPLF